VDIEPITETGQTPTALYRHFAADGALLYVGISLTPTHRLAKHRQRSAPWFRQIASITLQWFDSRQEALDAERDAIKAEGPAYNKAHVEPPIPEPYWGRICAAMDARELVLRQLAAAISEHTTPC